MLDARHILFAQGCFNLPTGPRILRKHGLPCHGRRFCRKGQVLREGSFPGDRAPNQERKEKEWEDVFQGSQCVLYLHEG